MDPQDGGDTTPVEHQAAPDLQELATTLVGNLAYDQHAMDPATLDREQTLGDSLQAILQRVEPPTP